MQTQSTWRRDHYLFDVHSSAWDAQQGMNIILPAKNDKDSSNFNTSTTTVFDHGLIYHRHANDEKTNHAEELLHHANTPKLKYHCSFDCDAVGSSIIFCQPQINTTFIEDPFRLAVAQREANKRACSTSSSNSSYLMESDPSKRRKTTAGAS